MVSRLLPSRWGKEVCPYVLLALLVLLVPRGTQSQHGHGLESNSPYERFQKPQVKYEIQAEIFPREGLIRGWMDISWTNQSNDTISTICLDFGFSAYDDTTQFDFHTVAYTARAKARLTGDRESYCWLDSVLYQAARLNQPAHMRGQSLVELSLPVPIYPGEAGPLMISFETRFKPLGDSLAVDLFWEMIPQWFPQVAHYVGGEWQSTIDMEATDDHPMASYAISLSVDSSFQIVGSGELFNEKEHFGTVGYPSGDTVTVNVTNFLYAYNPDHPYRPKFEGGKKGYHFRLLNGNNFPILLTKQFRMDRASVDAQLIEIVYPSKVAEAWRERVGVEARTVLAGLSKKLGRYPYPILRIVALPEGQVSLGTREMIGLSERIGGNSDIRQALTVLIARSWLADFVLSGNSDAAIDGLFAFDEALTSILAEDVKTGFEGSQTIGPAEMVASSVSGWKLSTPFRIDRVKSMLNDLSLVVGPDKFMALVSELSNKHRFRLVTENDFVKIIEATCGDKGVELISQKQTDRSSKSLNLHRLKTTDQ